jgi:ABC-2 type transport system ATP-binding protein
MIIIDHGKVVANDTLHGLFRLLPVTNLLAIELENSSDGLSTDQLQNLPDVQSVELRAGILKVGLRDLSAGAPTILQWLVAHGHPYRHVVSERADLETVFLTLTGRSLRDT